MGRIIILALPLYTALIAWIYWALRRNKKTLEIDEVLMQKFLELKTNTPFNTNKDVTDETTVYKFQSLDNKHQFTFSLKNKPYNDKYSLVCIYNTDSYTTVFTKSERKAKEKTLDSLLKK